MRIVQDHPRLAAAAILMASITINVALYRLAIRNLPEDHVAENVSKLTDPSLIRRQSEVATPSVGSEPSASSERIEQDSSTTRDAVPIDAAAGDNLSRTNLSPPAVTAKLRARHRLEKNDKPHADKIKMPFDKHLPRNNLTLDALPSHKSEPAFAPPSEFESIL